MIAFAFLAFALSPITTMVCHNAGDHAVKTGANELEIACTIASVYMMQPDHAKDLKKAQQAALASRPACSGYINAVTSFVKHFTGGETFPLLKLLQSISTLFSIMVGFVAAKRASLPRLVFVHTCCEIHFLGCTAKVSNSV